MEKITIKGYRREKTGKEIAKKLRREGYLPAIIYGKDVNLPIKIPISELRLLKSHHFSESTLIEISLQDSNKENISCVIKDIQFHPLTDEVIHIDFMKVSMEEMVRVKVPVELKGEAKGVKEGGILEQMLWEIEIEALPLDIPEKIEVDISSLEIGDSIHVKDLELGDKIKIIEDPQETIVTIVAQQEEEEKAEVEEEEKEPEVIKEKKQVEES